MRLPVASRALSLNVRAWLSDKEAAFFAYQRLRRRDLDKLVQPETDVCVEGAPGAGNSYFFTGLRMANPDLRIAHHHHVAAQLARAERLAIPSLALLRNPIDSVVSRITISRHPLIGPNLRLWIAFWGAVAKRPETTLIVAFDTVVADPVRPVHALNARYGTRLAERFPTRDAVFEEMDRDRRARFEGQTGLNPNRPDERKADVQARLRPAVQAHPLAAPAVELYGSIVSDV